MITPSEGRSCPSCGSDSNSSKVEVTAAVPAESLKFDELRQYFVGFRKGQCFYSYFRCQCGLLWCPQYFSSEALSVLYESMPDNTSVSGERDSSRTQQGYTNMFIDGLSERATVLEIGADVGSLLAEVSRRKPKAKLLAVEPNRDVHDQLERSISSNGVIFRDISEIPPGTGADLIVAVHVMDHLFAPLEMLLQIRDRLRRAGGVVFIVVHDEKSNLRRMLGRKWAPFCLQHPQLFNPQSFKSLAERAGLQVQLVRKTSNWLSPRQSAELASSIGLLPQGLSSIFPRQSLPVRLGNFAMLLTTSD